MKNFIALTASFVMLFSFSAQANNGNGPEDPKTTTVAGYEGGRKQMLSYIKENLTYPISARINGIEGTVEISFVVLQDGTIYRPVVKQSLDKKCDEEALRVIRNMPKWQPARLNGKAAASKVNLIIDFSLEI
jgi:protein TonB